MHGLNLINHKRMCGIRIMLYLAPWIGQKAASTRMSVPVWWRRGHLSRLVSSWSARGLLYVS